MAGRGRKKKKEVDIARKQFHNVNIGNKDLSSIVTMAKMTNTSTHLTNTENSIN